MEARKQSAVALVAVFACEFALFWWGTARHLAWIYPRWYDQVQYLAEAYNGYSQVGGHGFAAAAAATLAHASPQGALHGFLALLAFEVAGPSRSAALAVNLFAFIALQGATFLAVRRLSGSRPLAWAALGLLAALALPWSGTSGSATDFRLDWMAACAYGVALAAAILGRGFRSWRWATVLGFAVGAVLDIRFLTAVYFGLLFVAILAWLASGRERVARCGRLLLAAAIAAAVAAPPFWRSRNLIYTYYWVGHFAGPEHALRDAHMGPLTAAAWFVTEFIYRQVGVAALTLGLAAALALRLAGREAAQPALKADARGGEERDALILVLFFFSVPSAVLVLHPAKSVQPLAVILPAVVWLIVLAWIRLARGASRRRIAVIGFAAATVGLALFAAAQLRNPVTAAEESQYRSVNALDDFLYFRAEEAGLVNPRISATWVIDSLNAESLQVVGFERHGHLLHFIAMLPTGLFESPAPVVRARLADSDFVCLVRRAPSNWPFDREMASMLPETSGWCAANLRLDGSLDTADFSVDVYERPTLTRPEGGGVTLAAMLSGARSGRPFEEPLPPAAPYLRPAFSVLWSQGAALHYTLKAAYSPLKFSAAGLPEGLRLDSDTGEFTGHFPHPGRFAVHVAATNARGTSQAVVTFNAVNSDWEAELDAPAVSRGGAPATITFSAFDAGRGLDFIDITDLTSRRVLARLTPASDEKETWQGTYDAVLEGEGSHRIIARFVRFNPDAKEQYTYIDREFRVQVSH